MPKTSALNPILLVVLTSFAGASCDQGTGSSAVKEVETGLLRKRRRDKNRDYNGS